jgi:hypothetical protein
MALLGQGRATWFDVVSLVSLVIAVLSVVLWLHDPRLLLNLAFALPANGREANGCVNGCGWYLMTSVTYKEQL